VAAPGPRPAAGQELWAHVPPFFACRSYWELCRVRGWDKNLPGRILGALPQRTWVRRWQRLGQELLVRLWRHVEDKSPALRSRWQWTWVADESVVKKSGPQLGLVGTWYSGQEHRVRLGIDGLLLVVVLGEGNLVVPVDFVVRRPDPVGPGGPCRDKLMWLQVMLDRTWAALPRRYRQRPAPVVVADSWFGDSGLLSHVATIQRGTLVVEGKPSYNFQLAEGPWVKGHALRSRADGPWRDSPQAPRVRYARLTATSPTYGPVTLVSVAPPDDECFYVLCRQTTISAPLLIRAWRRRSAIEQTFRTLKPLLATEACQVADEDACRVGGGGAGVPCLRPLIQTARAVFPQAAFLRCPSLESSLHQTRNQMGEAH
jgi:hypothetical protein